MAVAPDRRAGVGLFDERIVGRHAAVVVDAVHLAVGPGDILRVRALDTFADGEEQVALTVEGDASAEVHAAGLDVMLGARLVDGLLVNEGAVLDPAADDAADEAAFIQIDIVDLVLATQEQMRRDSPLDLQGVVIASARVELDRKSTRLNSSH